MQNFFCNGRLYFHRSHCLKLISWFWQLSDQSTDSVWILFDLDGLRCLSHAKIWPNPNANFQTEMPFQRVFHPLITSEWQWRRSEEKVRYFCTSRCCVFNLPAQATWAPQTGVKLTHWPTSNTDWLPRRRKRDYHTTKLDYRQPLSSLCSTNNYPLIWAEQRMLGKAGHMGTI